MGLILTLGISGALLLLNYPMEDLITAEEGRVSRNEIPNGFDNLPWENWAWKSERGHIRGRWLSGTNCNGVVFFHGTGTDSRSMIKYAKVFWEKGYSLGFFDWIGSGKSDPGRPGFGFWEFSEGKGIFDYLKTAHTEISHWALFGESMGASVALTLASITGVKFVIADCPFSHFYNLCGEMMKRRLGFLGFLCPKWVELPALIICELLTKFIGHFSLTRNVILTALSSPEIAEKRILLFHGLDDLYVRPHHSQKIQNRLPEGCGELCLIPGARHAKSWRTNPEGYEQILSTFLERKVYGSGN